MILIKGERAFMTGEQTLVAIDGALGEGDENFAGYLDMRFTAAKRELGLTDETVLYPVDSSEVDEFELLAAAYYRALVEFPATRKVVEKASGYLILGTVREQQRNERMERLLQEAMQRPRLFLVGAEQFGRDLPMPSHHPSLLPVS